MTGKLMHMNSLKIHDLRMLLNVLMIRNYISPRSAITNDLLVWLEQSILLAKDGYEYLQTMIIEKSYY